MNAPKKYYSSVRREKVPVVTYEEAKADGLSSAFLRTISRSLERLSKDCFHRIAVEDFEPRFTVGDIETKASLTEAGKINSENAFTLRNLASRLKKEGK